MKTFKAVLILFIVLFAPHLIFADGVPGIPDISIVKGFQDIRVVNKKLAVVFGRSGGFCLPYESGTETSCSDGCDNDGDGSTDGADSDCGGSGECSGKILCFGGESDSLADGGSTGGNWSLVSNSTPECDILDDTELSALPNGPAGAFAGDYSLYCTQSEDAGPESFVSPDINYTPGATAYIFTDAWRDGPDGYRWEIIGWDDTDSIVFLGRITATAMRVYHGSNQNEIYPSIPADTHLYAWGAYTPGTGSNGVASMCYNTSGDYDTATCVQVTTGTATKNIQYIELRGGYNASTHYSLFDRSYLQVTAIGDVPD